MGASEPVEQYICEIDPDFFGCGCSMWVLKTDTLLLNTIAHSLISQASRESK